MTSPSSITCEGCRQAYPATALFCPNCGRAKVREETSDALLGKVLGERFLVQALLGQGASGTIYRAEHVTLRRKVAIKVLHAELSRDDLAVERFRREATTVAEIDNEHIVEIHDFGRTPDGRLYLAMELLEGETLDTVLARDHTLTIDKAADILIQVGEALMEAHAIGYVHRDLRPRNVYLAVRRGKPNFVKLLDFGLAKLVETDAQAASTSLGMTFGDPRYMSPEQARGDRIDRRADIYQLGCVAYEMLTGAPPFVGSRVFDILTKQVTEAPIPLPTKRPGVPLWMEAAVARMLAKNPDDRFATTTRMVEALRRGLATGEIMDDSVARRTESIPPPSVTRAIERLGAAPPPTNPVPAPSAAASAPKQAAVVVDSEPVRKRTGTPKLGMPIVPSAPVVPSPASVEVEPILPPVAGQVEDGTPMSVSGTIDAASLSKPLPKIESITSDTAETDGPSEEPGISQGWYDNTEHESRGHSGKRRARTDTHDGELDYEEAPRRRWGLLLGVLGVLVIGGGITYAMVSGSGHESTKTDPAVVAMPTPGPTTPTPAPSPAPALVADAAVAPVAVVADAAAPAIAVAPVAPTPAPTPARAPVTSGGHHDVIATAPPPRAPRSPIAHGGNDPLAGWAPGADDLAARRPGASPNPINAAPPAPFTPPPTPVTPPPTPVTPPPAPKDVSGTGGPVDPYNPAGPTAAIDPGDAATPADRKAEFYASLGTQQLVGGETAAAAASFKKATELDPKNAVAAIGMGDIALRQGLFGDAISHLRRAAKLAPRNAQVYVLLGDAFLNSGQSAQAAQNFKRALQLDPDNARARDGYNEASSRVPPPSDDQ